MKKIVIALVLLGGITAFAFASLKSTSKKEQTEKKTEKKEKKKECKRTCIFG
jgi:flagellar basal body-associated protein FliL